MTTRNPVALAIRLLMLVALSATLSASSPVPGADSFKVFLDGKLLFEQYVTHDAGVEAISLSNGSPDDLLTIYYDHCGRIGSNRTLTLMDGKNVLKKWHYPDTQSVASSGMACRIGDIKSLQKAGVTMNMVYASQELQSPIKLLTFSSDGTATSASQ